MRTDLEKRFFEAFDIGGVALSCISELADNTIPEGWENIIQQQRQRIIAETEAFNFSIINSNRKAPIIQEIENNLHILTGRARENYLYSLLTPFAEWLRIVGRRIEEYETEWSKQNAKNRAERVFNILNGHYSDGTIEQASKIWDNALRVYANRLDALLLQEGEDLFKLQEITGIKLIECRDISAMEFYIGSYSLAQKYIAELTNKVTDLVTSTENPTGTSPDEWKLPLELNTNKARSIIARAIEQRYIIITTTGLEWIAINGRGGNSQLGYFLSKIYEQPRPITALENLFGVKKLSTYIGNADFDVKRADVIKWRAEIDSLFIE